MWSDNVKWGVGSIVIELELRDMSHPNSGSEYDARVHITVLPMNKLAELEDLIDTINQKAGLVITPEALASQIHRDVKAAYSTGDDYSAKSEVIVSTDDLYESKIRVHVAG